MSIIKFIPIALAAICFVNIILQFFGISSIFLLILGLTSILCLLFLFLSSFVFKFCYYHRLPLYYIAIALSICLYDTYIGLPVSNAILFMIHVLLFIAVVILLIKFYFK